VELSVSGALATGLNVVAGAVLMDPRVTGTAVAEGRVGPRPVAQTRTRMQISLDYRVPNVDGLSLDLTATHFRRRTANLANTLETSAETVLNVGFRYRMDVGKTPTALRVQLRNVTNEFTWEVNRSGGFQPSPSRTLVASLTADF
jgi:iron complex outermembrane receptor protein